MAATEISGSEIRQWRTEMGMTQAQLGAELGCGESYVAHMESGSRPCRGSKAILLVKLYEEYRHISSVLNRKTNLGDQSK